MEKTFNKRSSILMALFVQFLLSCGQNQEGKKTIPNEHLTSNSDQISVDTFSAFPPEIDGCACYFSNDEVQFKNGKYIYADNYENTAFVLIDGVMTKFELSKSDTIIDHSLDHSIQTFANDKYELTIEVEQVSQLDETWQKRGTITIKNKNGNEKILRIYGECGC